jgi:hypothetical protein
MGGMGVRQVAFQDMPRKGSHRAAFPLRQSDGTGSDELRRDKPEDELFVILEGWKSGKAMKMAEDEMDEEIAEVVGEDDGADSDSDVEDDQPVHTSLYARLMWRFMIGPTSLRRIAWDFVGCWLVFWDFLLLPYYVFNPPETTFLMTMTWIVRIYWSADMPTSLCTGYSLPEGRSELDPVKVLVKFARTWMVFDLLIVGFDWVDFAIKSQMDAEGGSGEAMGAARAGKALKVSRLLRMVRLIRLARLVKMPEVFSSFTYQFESERTSIVFGIIRMMIFLIMVTHIMACCWYGIGNSTEGNTWVVAYGLEGTSTAYAYSTSFHWALTQFTGSMDVQPENSAERFFAVLTLTFGFLLSAMVVSNITSSLTRLQIVSARSSTQVAMLNRYLHDNGISTKVALRVQRNATYALAQEKKNTPESSIELLELVSEPLRVELHYEIYGPILTWYGFFRCYKEANGPGMRRVCHTAISRLSLSRGDILFSTGELPPFPAMYFILSGRLNYQRPGSASVNMYSGEWACEGVLWTEWVHCGCLRARSECSLILLDAHQFQATALQYQTNECYPTKYAMAFVKELNNIKRSNLTDLPDVGFNVADICERIFTPLRGRTTRFSSPHVAAPLHLSNIGEGCERQESR